MRWDRFEPKTGEELAGIRAVAMLIEGEDPTAEIVPIDTSNVSPRKCIKCGGSMSFMATDVQHNECPKKEGEHG